MNSTMTALDSPCDLARTRQDVYRFLRSALVRPTPEQHAWLNEAGFETTLETLCAAFDLPYPPGPLVPAEFAGHESRYLACFEVGMPGPPVPLVASHYNRREPAPRILYEHVLFYRQFGVAVPADSVDPADHLGHQLAFLIHLDDLLDEESLAPVSVLRARHDFLSRHLVAWTQEASQAAVEKHLPPLYQALLGLLGAAVVQDRELTAAALDAFPAEQP
jgi:DMSO reductase family type II enzyme chaperone